MPFTITVPAADVSPLDTRPIAALVAEAPEHMVAAKLREIAACTETIVTDHRLKVRARVQSAIATLSAAELDGWYVDCAPMAEAISRVEKMDSTAVAELNEAVKKLVRSAHGARVPGANTLHTYQQRIRDAFRCWLNDLEDYAHDLEETMRRMKARGSSAPMTQAGIAYARAVKDVLQIDVEPQTSVDFAGEPQMFVTVPLPSDVRYDREKRRDIERRIHSEVGNKDGRLVGMVALKFEARQQSCLASTLRQSAS